MQNLMHFFPIQNLKFYMFVKKNLTRCKIYEKKTFFKQFFQILAELLLNFYQHWRTTCWKMKTAWGEKLFFEYVACVRLTIRTIFLLIEFFMAIGSLRGVMTISFELPTELYKCLWNSKLVSVKYFSKMY